MNPSYNSLKHRAPAPSIRRTGARKRSGRAHPASLPWLGSPGRSLPLAHGGTSEDVLSPVGRTPPTLAHGKRSVLAAVRGNRVRRRASLALTARVSYAVGTLSTQPCHTPSLGGRRTYWSPHPGGPHHALTLTEHALSRHRARPLRDPFRHHTRACD